MTIKLTAIHEINEFVFCFGSGKQLRKLAVTKFGIKFVKKVTVTVITSKTLVTLTPRIFLIGANST